MPTDLEEILKSARALLHSPQHPRNGKVARLPAATRTWINQMLDDGFRYRQIIIALQASPNPPPYTLSEMNLSNWYHGGYQDWRRQRLLNETRSAAAAGQPPRTEPHLVGANRTYSEVFGATKGNIF